MGKGGVFSRAGWDQLKIAYNNPCKTKIFECDWIGHPEVIAEESTVNLWHHLDFGARGKVEDVIASLEWLGGPQLESEYFR